MNTDYSYIDRNFEQITDGIERAAASSPTGEVPELLIASKSADLGEIEYLVEKYGIRRVGENRVEQLLSRYDSFRALGLEVHFIGSLQTNKVAKIIDKVDLIHSLDRVSLARELDKQARRRGICVDVLIEINSAREEGKGGVLPENLEAFCNEISAFDAVKVRGFMTMGKKCEKKCEYLKYFCETYQLVLDIWTKKYDNIYKPIISMGMSDSFVQATQAGSTLVRIGRGMFIKNQ